MAEEQVERSGGKKEFAEHLQELMEILERSKRETDYINGADIIKQIFELYNNIEKNEYHFDNFADREIITRRHITDEEKLNNPKFSACSRCNGLVSKSQMKRHQKTKKCKATTTSKVLASSQKTIKLKKSYEQNKQEKEDEWFRVIKTTEIFLIKHIRILNHLEIMPPSYIWLNDRERYYEWLNDLDYD